VTEAVRSERPYVVAAGDGPLVVCLHGIGSSSASFAAQLAEPGGLADVARVVAWDAPGYGRSPDPVPGSSLGDLARVVADLVGEHGDRAVLLGMSWGGVLAARVALDHPELVAGLVLGDSTPGSATDPARAAAMRARVPELVELGARAFAHQRAPRLLRPGAPRREVDAAVALMAAAVRPAGYAVAAESMAATDLRGELDRLDVPTLVFYGAEDRVTGRSHSRELTAIRGSRLVEIPDAGHLANQENPTYVNRVLADFLGELAPITSGRTR